LFLARNPNRPAIYQFGQDGHLIIPGSHFVVLRLGHRGYIQRLEIDTNHFKGNFPESCIMEV